MPSLTHVHTIAFKGIAGAILVLTVTATLLYVLAFATVGWSVSKGQQNTNTGLWKQCSCGDLQDNSVINAARAMIAIGLCGLLICCILIFIYMLIDAANKSSTLIAFTVTCLLSVLFMLIGYIIWGVEYKDSVGYSFIISVIAAAITLAAGVVAVAQLRKASVV